MHIRQATRLDMPGIWEVRYSVSENTLKPGKITDEELWKSLEVDGCGWVAEERNQILGFAIGLASSGNLWALFVKPDAQGQGIGTQLHNKLLEWFSAQPVSRLWLSTGTRTRARRFYEARGWQYVGPYGDTEVRLERQNAIQHADLVATAKE